MPKPSAKKCPSARRVLKERFGLPSFRPGQEEIISSLLAGADVLAILPTAAGKSLLYQLTAQLLPGITVVVSPLLALMKDQAEALESQGIGAAVVSSARGKGEIERDFERLVGGEAKLLYVTPERFGNAAFMRRLEGLPVSLFVVDEAHCISAWGQDFRRSYLELGSACERLGRPPVLAITATARPAVQDDIVAALRMRSPERVVHGFDRENLYLEVVRVEDEREDRAQLGSLFAGVPEGYSTAWSKRLEGAMAGSGIVYVRTTAAARETCQWLRELGVSADYYHGQRRKADRERVQQAFMDGRVRVMVATNAFGLGIDKPDVRFVIHRDVPASLDAYYQEAGRAGRDGAFSRCVLIYRQGDLAKAAFLSAGGTLSAQELRRALRLLKHGPRSRRDLLGTGAERARRVRAFEALRRRGCVAERKGALAARASCDIAGIVEDEERRHEDEREGVYAMERYAEIRECRRSHLLGYFGERADGACGMCDNDVPHARSLVTVDLKD